MTRVPRAALVEAARNEAVKRRTLLEQVVQGPRASEAIDAPANLGVASLAVPEEQPEPGDALLPLDVDEQDNDLLELLTAVDGATSSMSKSAAASHLPADQLTQCFLRIVAQKRAQIVHNKLQMIVYEHTRPPVKEFSLPEPISTPRRVHNIDVREAWWMAASGHPDILRKQDTCASPASAVNENHTLRGSKSAPGLGSVGNAAALLPALRGQDGSKPSKLVDGRPPSRGGTKKASSDGIETTGGASRPSPSSRKAGPTSPSEKLRVEAHTASKRCDYDCWKQAAKTGHGAARGQSKRQREERKSRRASHLQKVELHSMYAVTHTGFQGGESPDSASEASTELGSELTPTPSSDSWGSARLPGFLMDAKVAPAGACWQDSKTLGDWALPMVPKVCSLGSSAQAPTRTRFLEQRQKLLDARVDHVLESLQAQRMRAFAARRHLLATTGSSQRAPVVTDSNHTRQPCRQTVAAFPPMRDSWNGNTAAQRAYLEESTLRQHVPSFPVCLEASATGPEEEPAPVDIRYMNLNDEEAAPMLMGLQRRAAAISGLLLAGNPRLTDASYVPLLRLTCAQAAAAGARPLRLDLTGARGVGERSLALLTQEFSGELSELRVLRLDGVAVAEHIWPALVPALAGLQRLEELGLADVQAGRASQRSAAAAAETLLGLPALKALDLSNNFFGLEGCRALAENLGYHRSLQRLDLSHNAGGFVASTGSTGRVEPGGSAGGGLAFNPMSLVCESIAQARGLRSLSLASCQLNFDEDFLLEEALAVKVGVKLEELDLSGNSAQGSAGARCLVRLLVQQPSLRRLDLRNLRRAPPTPSAVPYEFGDPSANYELDLGYPQHRALLRTLLRKCQALGEKEEDLIQFRPDFERLGRDVLGSWRRSREVPSAGRLCLVFRLPQPPTSLMEAGIGHVISTLDCARKLRVGLCSFVRIGAVFRELADVEARRIVVGAMACDLMLKLSHVRYLSGLDTRLRLEVIDKLLPAVQNLNRYAGMELVYGARAVSDSGGSKPLHVGHASTLKFLLFNASCPNANYALDLACPADRRIIEQIVIINQWEQEHAKARNHADLSEWGGHECLRNTLLNGCKVVWRNLEFTLPTRGELSFDYCSPFHQPANAEHASEETLQALALALQKARCDPVPKVLVLRSYLHLLTLKAGQCAQLLHALPPWGDTSFASFDSAGAAVVKSARADAFVALYARCTDIGNLVSAEAHGLYGLAILSREEVHVVRRRLGKLRTWDITRCDEDELCPWAEIIGPRSTDWRVRKQETEDDERKMVRILQDYNMLDDPTSRGNANRYALDLGVPEERQFATVMMKLGQREAGEHFDEPYWSAKEKLLERGTRWLVPEDWNVEVPDTGIFKVRYYTERTGCKDVAFRKALASKYLGW